MVERRRFAVCRQRPHVEDRQVGDDVGHQLHAPAERGRELPRELAQVPAPLTHHVEPERVERREDRGRERREQHRQRRHHGKLEPGQVGGLEDHRPDAPMTAQGQDHPQHDGQGSRHHPQRAGEAEPLAHQICGPADRPGQQVVDGAPLDLLRHQARSHQQDDQQAQDRDDGETQIDGQPEALAQGQAVEHLGAEDRDHPGNHHTGDDAVAGGLAERVARDERDGHADLRASARPAPRAS